MVLQKTIAFDTFKAPKEQHSKENIMFFTNFLKIMTNDHEAKTYGFGSHLEAILGSSWGIWKAFGGHFGRLGANLSQHKAILSHLGANLRPT